MTLQGGHPPFTLAIPRRVRSSKGHGPSGDPSGWKPLTVSSPVPPAGPRLAGTWSKGNTLAAPRSPVPLSSLAGGWRVSLMILFIIIEPGP